jgi:Transposase
LPIKKHLLVIVNLILQGGAIYLYALFEFGLTMKYINYIENTLKYDYNNGVLEGINNKIKVIKRIAFGYKCFYHFKNRILITQNLATIKGA